MKLAKVPSLFLALAIQLSPLASRLANVTPALAASPMAIVLKWISGAIAAAGAMHAVSAASIPVTLLSANPIKGTNGVKITPDYTIRLGEARNPPVIHPAAAWDINGVQVVASSTLRRASNGVPAGVVFPRGLSLVLATGVITGTPLEAGNSTVNIRAWRNSDRRGDNTTFSLNFQIASSATAPLITSPPVATSAQVGGTASFTVVATGNALTYKWLKDDAAVGNGTAATLTLNPVKPTDDGFYKVIVTSDSLSVTSNPVRLTVTLPTAITSHPAPKSVHVGEKVVLTVGATGEGSLKYVWKRGQTSLLDQTGASLVINAASLADAGDYTVAVTGNNGVANSNSAKVTVVDAPLAKAMAQGNSAVIHFGAIAGRTYSVEEAETLGASPTWKTVGTVTPNSAEGSFSADLPSITKFWRVKVQPE
jgi:hypothetical protein